MACGTPWAASPWVSVVGRGGASPAIISVKNTPIESTKPEFWNVASMPDAAPRCLAGTLFMTPAAFGAENGPVLASATMISRTKYPVAEVRGDERQVGEPQGRDEQAVGGEPLGSMAAGRRANDLLVRRSAR